MSEGNFSDSWAKFVLEQAQLIVHHLETETPDRDFVYTHAMTLLQVTSYEGSPGQDRRPADAKIFASLV